jgi:hypothetical protein
MSGAQSYIRTHLAAVAAGVALIAAVLIAGGLTAALIKDVAVPGLPHAGHHGAVTLADARHHRAATNHGPVPPPRPTRARSSAAAVVTTVRPSRPVRARPVVRRTRKAHRPRTRTRTRTAPPAAVATPAPVVSMPPAPAPATSTARHDNGRHVGQTRTTHDNGRHLGQIRKSSPPPAAPPAHAHGNPHGTPPGQVGKKHVPPGHTHVPPGHTAGHGNGHKK